MAEERAALDQASSGTVKELIEVKARLNQAEQTRDAAQKEGLVQAQAGEAARNELNAVQEQLESLKLEHSKSLSNLEAGKSHSAQLSAQLDEAQRKLDALGDDRKKIGHRHEELARQLATREADIAKATDQGALLKKDNEIFAVAMKEANEKLESLARQKESARHELESARLEIEALSEQKRDWARQSDDMRNEITSLAEKRRLAQQTAENVSASLAEAEAGLKTARTEGQSAAEAQQHLADARAKAGAMTTELNALRERCQELTANIKEQKQKPDTEKALEQFKTAINKKDEEIARLKHELGVVVKKSKAAPPAETSPAPPPAAQSVEPPPSPGFRTLRLEKSQDVEKPSPIPAGPVSVPTLLAAMRNRLHYFIRHPNDPSILDELARHTAQISELTTAAESKASNRLAALLGDMIGDLCKRPEQVNPATLRTLSQSVDFLSTLQESKNASKSADLPSGTAYVVDDDPGILEAIVPALKHADLDVSCTEQPKEGLKTLAGRRFDLILLDVGLPEMNGMDLCTKIRGIPGQQKTPIIFLTGMDTVQNRVQSMLSGGNDFIGKPFNTLELAAKSLIWVLKGQLGLT